MIFLSVPTVDYPGFAAVAAEKQCKSGRVFIHSTEILLFY